MATGVLTNEFLDDFPKTTRPGSGNSGRQTTDVDVALEKLAADGAPSRVLKLIDYNTSPVIGPDGEPTGETEAVEASVARGRASGRIAPLKKRGYDVSDGWLVVARNGAVYAKFYGVGNVPVKETKPVGEQIPV